MQPKTIKDFVKKRGVTDIVSEDLKGPKNKELIKSSIINSKNKGKTTIWIDVHGLPNYVCLAGAVPGTDSVYGKEDTCNGFRYNEFVDILLQRGNLEEVNLIIESCFSYNFADQLIDDLESKKSESYPTIVTVSNKGKYGVISLFLDSLDNLNLKDNEHLLGKHIYKAEEFNFGEKYKLLLRQDLVVFFSKEKIEKPLEISQNYLNHECTSEECIGGVCPVTT